MCWSSNTIPIKNIATKNIICYKIFYKDDIIWKRRKFLNITFGKKIERAFSLWRRFLYIPYNINPEINIDISYWSENSNWFINEGYHSYKTINKVKNYIKKTSYIIKCIIPKNSIYYINKQGDIVSSNIIITDKIIN